MARIASKKITENSVVFEFVDGNRLECNIDKIPADIQKRLMLHGLSQKVGDSYASAESVGDAVVSANDVWNNLKSNVWATKSSRGGKLVEALHRATGNPYDDCLEAYRNMDKTAVAALKKHPDIIRAIAEIDLELANAAKEAAKGQDAPSLNALFK